MGSLPPALLARLQKRGIVKATNEEVIAESYDSSDTKEKKQAKRILPELLVVRTKGTPENRLSESYQRKRRRMLAKFPLPEPWVEVYDAGIARHYYWNQDTDEVCWVSPRHPIAVIGEAAPRLAKELKERMEGAALTDLQEKKAEHAKLPLKSALSKRKRRNSDDSDEMSERDRLKRARRKGIDPMDPAAYGDVPVGKWSSGLHAHDKTGADVTAGGPLFQQRPYPAPGAILRQQKKKADEDKD
ncbi:hypothetical protein KIN20_025816 [Parelaphostrongylus tenuis]|uniref:Polyglutamine-binding protein 1 n=1 Tax=Parelaphostrongylus tenuis TaxID=148309 RepID=A0AAD5MVU3_PARTN|nr:hypothetical protein KIN20_025816 [Parelaphostrongylus tenuis]